jgi:hypothetical protein
MGPARFWDDPDADLDKTVDLPVPPAVRARFEPVPGEDAPLDQLAHAINLIGLVLITLGLAALLVFSGDRGSRLRPTIVVTGLFTLPGALYVVASVGLTCRQLWAWLMTLVVTLILLSTLVCTGVYLAATGEPDRLLVLLPTAFYFPIPCVILHYAMRARPYTREAWRRAQRAFDGRPATVVAAAPQPPPRAVSFDQPDGAGKTTSPSPAPPAPWPPTPPPRS